MIKHEMRIKMSLLDEINSSADVARLTLEEKNELCKCIRQRLVNTISKTGGHLASNLGVVELTVALHSVFDIPGDKFVWDVGHQSYVNKLLTGRNKTFDTIRTLGGISGFPKRSESDADVFNTGHSSTSISAALGLARARDLDGDNYAVGAIFGDGALTGGMMYEAMNDAGRLKSPFILILNDNNMSISRNVGSLSKYLRALRIKPGYAKIKLSIEGFFDRIPLIGNHLKKFTKKVKELFRRLFLQNTIFENLGFEYLGPIDGHDLEKLTNVFKLAKSKKKPVFIHVITKKGKGYIPAEKNPEDFHGVGKFNCQTGVINGGGKDFSAAFGEALCTLADENEKIVGITCAMPSSTGMRDFEMTHKNRFFDVGIAEQHGVTMAAGLAAGGYIPIIPIYSSFLQRAYDQILHDVCLQNLHVVFPVDRAGIVGADGETHQGIYDVSFLSSMPNMAILSPSSFAELSDMLRYAVLTHNGPIAIRYPRGGEQYDGQYNGFEFAKVNVIQKCNGKITIFASGRTVNTALKAAEILGGAKVVAVPTIKPLDRQGILENVSEITAVIEDAVCVGGLCTMIGEIIAEGGKSTRYLPFAFPDEPITHGSVAELDRKYGLDAQSIADKIKQTQEN